jgi:hypothetical protein
LNFRNSHEVVKFSIVLIGSIGDPDELLFKIFSIEYKLTIPVFEAKNYVLKIVRIF